MENRKIRYYKELYGSIDQSIEDVMCLTIVQSDNSARSYYRSRSDSSISFTSFDIDNELEEALEMISISRRTFYELKKKLTK